MLANHDSPHYSRWPITTCYIVRVGQSKLVSSFFLTNQDSLPSHAGQSGLVQPYTPTNRVSLLRSLQTRYGFFWSPFKDWLHLHAGQSKPATSFTVTNRESLHRFALANHNGFHVSSEPDRICNFFSTRSFTESFISTRSCYHSVFAPIPD